MKIENTTAQMRKCILARLKKANLIVVGGTLSPPHKVKEYGALDLPMGRVEVGSAAKILQLDTSGGSDSK